MLSTNCKGCHTYLKIEKGAAVSPEEPLDQPRFRSTSEPTPKASPEPTPKKTAPQKTAVASKKSPRPEKSSPQESKAKATPASPQKTPPTKKVGKKQPTTKKPPSKSEQNPPSQKTKPTAPPPKADQKVSAQSKPAAKVSNQPAKPQAPSKETKKATKKATANTSPAAPLKEKSAQETETTSRYRPAEPKTAPKSGLSPLLSRDRKRSVKCFECAEEHEILADSTSAMCPHCGAYIGLKNYDIREQENSRIQTRGNVFVHKKGYVSGITIQAHNLTIEGEIQGGAECTGDFIVRKTGKINGAINSDRVIIERRAEVEFLSTVQAREVIINGHVTGSVSCKKLTLQKKATLDGDLTVASLSVEEGARHNGNIMMKPLL